MRLRPDLVIVHAGPHNVAGQLSALGIESITVDRGTLAGVYSSIRDIGAAADAHDRAARLIAELEQRLAAVRAEAAKRPPRKVLVIVGRQPGTLADLVAVGRGTNLEAAAAELLRVLTMLEPGTLGQQEVGSEE